MNETSNKSSHEMNVGIRNADDALRVAEFAGRNPDAFWAGVAHRQLEWRKTWTQVSDCDFNLAQVNWFPGGELNVSENCLDRHIRAGRGNKKALIWVSNDLKEERILTFAELHREVCRVANALESLRIKKGDRVVFYMPAVPELAIGILACARIGVIHSVIFGGFSSASIHNRVVDCGAKLIITADGSYRGNKWIDLKVNVDEAMLLGCPSVEKVIVFTRNSQHPVTPRSKDFSSLDRSKELSWDEWVNPNVSDDHKAPSHSALDPLFILYTSGSTGKPKGVLHRMGGYLTYVSYSHEIVFQPLEEDVYWCTADMGWITGHSYVLYGPLSNGVTTVMFEGIPTHPDPGCFWEIIDRYQVSIFYTAPTAIRILASLGDEHVKKHSRASLRILGTVGEPISPEAWKWYQHTVGQGRIPIVDTWWQTETGGILISALAGVSPSRPGSASFPLPGIEVRILDDHGKPIVDGISGNLVLSRSWPGQMAGVYGDPQRFYDTYFTRFPGYYWTGDAAHCDEDGFYWITGRTDDVIKVSGHRLGTAEIESACMVHPGVIESAAVGVLDSTTGEALHLFVVLKEGVHPSDTLFHELVQVVRKEVGALATPKKIYWVAGLPKTRSGKIMRRLLRKIAEGEHETLGDISSLADPGVIEGITNSVRQHLASHGG